MSASGACFYLALFLAALLSACTTTPSGEADPDPREGLAAATPPVFMRGPMGIVLTNGEDFTARVTLTAVEGGAPILSGTLFHQEDLLLFVPRSEDALPETSWAGTFRFLWDVRRNSGFVMSERIRGYASVSIPQRFELMTNRLDSGASAVEPIDAQPCALEELSVTAHPGAPSTLRVWRDLSLLLPRQMRATDEAKVVTVHLSQLNTDRLAADLFALPPGFMRYNSPEDMVHELLRKPRIMPYSTSGGYVPPSATTGRGSHWAGPGRRQ